MMPKKADKPVPIKPLGLIAGAIDGALAAPPDIQALAVQTAQSVPQEQMANLNEILERAPLSYRDAVLIQAAYGILGEGLDLTQRHSGARSVAQNLGEYLADKHIAGVADAFQNIGKNTTDLARGNVQSFDSFLRWASKASKQELSAALVYVAARVAATSRPTKAMPELDRSKLTFAGVSSCITSLFAAGSQGAYEQFAVAALLEGLMVQSGVAGVRVETKNLNASDKSAGSAADVQVLVGNRVVEAYEVTANDWREKLPGALTAIKHHDLTRLHIIGRVAPDAHDGIANELKIQRLDLSVLDVKDFCRTLIASLDKAHRKLALERFYDLLDRYQMDVEKVNAFVNALSASDLVAG